MTQPQAQQRLDRTTHLWFLLGKIKDETVIQKVIDLFGDGKLEESIELVEKTIELQKCLYSRK